MASLLENILTCLFGEADDHVGHVMEKQSLLTNSTQSGTPDEIATDVLNILRTAEKNGHQLERDLHDAVRATAGGWTEGIAKAVLNKLVDLLSLESREKLGPAIREALERAEEVADGIFDFAHDHPVAVAVFCTILAIGVLWFMAPWVLEVLGFAAEGPIEGKSNSTPWCWCCRSTLGYSIVNTRCLQNHSLAGGRPLTQATSPRARSSRSSSDWL